MLNIRRQIFFVFGEMRYALWLKSLERQERRCAKAKEKWRDLLRYKGIWYVLPEKWQKLSLQSSLFTSGSLHLFILSLFPSFCYEPVPFLPHLTLVSCLFLTLFVHFFSCFFPKSHSLLSCPHFCSSPPSCHFLASFPPLSSSVSPPPFLILKPPASLASSSSYPPSLLLLTTTTTSLIIYTQSTSQLLSVFWLPPPSCCISSSISSPRCAVIAARLATAATADSQTVAPGQGGDDDDDDGGGEVGMQRWRDSYKAVEWWGGGYFFLARLWSLPK